MHDICTASLYNETHPRVNSPGERKLLMNILLDNGQVLVEVERQNGRLVRFEHKQLGIRLVQEPRLAENFRLMLPLPNPRTPYIYGKKQVLSDVQESENTCVLTW